MTVRRGDFLRGLEEPHALVLATGNGVVRRDGSLVMGAGSAKALAGRFPQLPFRLGRLLGRRPGLHRYGLLVAREGPYLVGVFQTKEDWRQPSSLELIGFSAEKLRGFLEAHPGLTAHLAFPGVGLGGLREAEVLPVLEAVLGGFQVVLWKA